MAKLMMSDWVLSLLRKRASLSAVRESAGSAKSLGEEPMLASWEC